MLKTCELVVPPIENDCPLIPRSFVLTDLCWEAVWELTSFCTLCSEGTKFSSALVCRHHNFANSLRSCKTWFNRVYFNCCMTFLGKTRQKCINSGDEEIVIFLLARLQTSFRNFPEISRRVGWFVHVAPCCVFSASESVFLCRGVFVCGFFWLVEVILQNNGIIQIRKNTGNSVAQLSTWDRFSFEIRPGYSKLYRVVSQNPIRLETSQLLCITFSTNPLLKA